MYYLVVLSLFDLLLAKVQGLLFTALYHTTYAMIDSVVVDMNGFPATKVK